MNKLFEHLLANLNPNPEIKPEEKLNFSELKGFVNHTGIAEKRKQMLAEKGLDKLLLGQYFFQFLDLPTAAGLNWQKLFERQTPNTMGFNILFWVIKLEVLVEKGDFLEIEIGRFKTWEKSIGAKFPKLNPEHIDAHLLMNIWVDYKFARLVLEHIKDMPDSVKKVFEEAWIDLTGLIFNIAELFEKNIDDFKDRKATVYGQGGETSKYRIPLSQLKELQEIIENIQSINIRYLNKGLQREHLLELQKEIAKINIDLMEKIALRRIREAKMEASLISERQLFELLNDFLVALNFKKAITEEDEMNHLKKEGVTMDTIRQMKKRLIMGIEK